MKEFTAFRGEFKGWENRESDRREFLRRAIKIISDTAWASIGPSLLIKDWEKCNEEYMLEEEMFRPYALCGWACVDHVRLWCREQRRPYPFNEVTFVFEEGDPDQQQLKQIVKKDCRSTVQTEKKLPDDGSPPLGALQAADFAAWHVRNAVKKSDMGELERFREDFEMLFSKVRFHGYHSHFSMTPIAEMKQDGLLRLSTGNPEWEKEASLIRFCHDRRIPRRQT